MRYYIADSHFYHGALNTKMDKRGFESVEAMNEYMIEKWNERVRRNDEVVILGDLSYGSTEETEELLKRLKGKLFLVPGNHDRWIKHSSLSRFEWVKEYAEMRDNGRKVICCHYPIACYNGQFKGQNHTYMLHGHIHNTSDVVALEHYKDFVKSYSRESINGELVCASANIINCFCLFSDYVPLSLDEWISLENSGELKKL